ncbi:hypothetical protein ABLO27_14895 [Roseibium sp. SCPC15]|uniref:hypothetical protein n=1 Tax=Roseibium sp. SCP15 TaxID=3141376 RepID=UPI00333620FA
MRVPSVASSVVYCFVVSVTILGFVAFEFWLKPNFSDIIEIAAICALVLLFLFFNVILLALIPFVFLVHILNAFSCRGVLNYVPSGVLAAIFSPVVLGVLQSASAKETRVLIVAGCLGGLSSWLIALPFLQKDI